MRTAITLVILAFAVMPRVNAAPINNSTQVQEVQTVTSVENEPKQNKQAQQNKPKTEKKTERTPKATKVVKVQPPTGSKEEWLRLARIPESQWGYVDYIITKESSWRPNAVNYLNCIGLYQACPDGDKAKFIANCPDWQTDVVCSLKEATRYSARYGGWEGAYSAWKTQGWW